MKFENIIRITNKWLNDQNKVFAAAVAVALFATLCTVLFTSDIYRDTAYVYAVFAREWGRGNISDGIAVQVPMLNIFLAGLLNICGIEAVKALALVGGLFYTALCFPLRKLLERYLSPTAAAWGCMLAVTAPRMIRFGCAALIDSASVFFLISAVLFFLRLSEKPQLKNVIFFGISTGFLAAARCEGFIIAAALLLGEPLFTALFRRPADWKKQFSQWVIALFCALAAVSPFCLMNYSKSGYFVTDTRIVHAVKNVVNKMQSTPTPSPVPAPPTANGETERANGIAAKAAHMFSCIARAGYELYLLLAAVGLAVICRRKELKSDYLLFAGLTILYCLIYFFTISATRYYLFTVPLFMVFTVTGANFLREQLIRYVPAKFIWLVPTVCAVILFIQTGNGLKRAFSSKGKDFQAAGAWIKSYGERHFPERKLRLFAPGMAETAYWSGAEDTDGYEKEKHDPQSFCGFDLAVVHRKKSFGMEKRADLERLNDTPHSKDIWIFKLKKQEDK